MTQPTPWQLLVGSDEWLILAGVAGSVIAGLVVYALIRIAERGMGRVES